MAPLFRPFRLLRMFRSFRPSRPAGAPLFALPAAPALLVLLAVSATLLTACAGGPPPAVTEAAVATRASYAPQTAAMAPKPSAPGLPRANPSYIQWLERQSLLRATPDLAAIVSGSGLAWRAPAGADPAALLRQASVWLDFNPYEAAWSGSPTALTALQKSNVPARLAALGVHGLIIAPAAEPGAAWEPEARFGELGADEVSFSFAKPVGTDEDYAALEKLAAQSQMLLAGDLLPAATGMGPDFFLAMRGTREYPGLYMLVEAAPGVWPLFPLSLLNEGANGKPVPPAIQEQLRRDSALPPPFARDGDPRLTPGGWAVTPEMVGVDGVNRRWLYRYVGSPARPVLNWGDPSGAARRVLAASVIRQVGILHQPLVGMHLEAFWDQEPLAPGATPSGEPALSALRDLSRDVRRYGAFALLRDAFPPDMLPLLLENGADFVRDTVTSPSLEYAMLTGNTAPLKHAIDNSLKRGVNHARLWRAPAGSDGIRLDLAGFSPSAALVNMDESNPWRAVLPLRGNTLYATAASLAAAAVGLSPDEARRAAQKPEDLARIQQAHMLQIAFRALQPGLLMLSGHDLNGSLFAAANPDVPEIPAGVASWSLDGSRQLATRQGIPTAAAIYPPWPDAKPGADGKTPLPSFAGDVRRVLDIRQNTGVAAGRLQERLNAGASSVVALLSVLPDGRLLLVAGNFSNTGLTTDIRLPKNVSASAGEDALSGNGVAVQAEGLRLRMDAWGWRAVLLLPGGGAA